MGVTRDYSWLISALLTACIFLKPHSPHEVLYQSAFQLTNCKRPNLRPKLAGGNGNAGQCLQIGVVCSNHALTTFPDLIRVGCPPKCDSSFLLLTPVAQAKRTGGNSEPIRENTCLQDSTRWLFLFFSHTLTDPQNIHS